MTAMVDGNRAGEKTDMEQVIKNIFSHSNVPQKNMLVIKLIVSDSVIKIVSCPGKNVFATGLIRRQFMQERLAVFIQKTNSSSRRLVHL